jgi:DNA-binding PadR family transcriptional regulator
MMPSELFKGLLKSLVLKLLRDEGPMYGYRLTGRLEQITSGRLKLTSGSLYQILHKLKSEGALVTAKEHHNNRIRIYYALTPKGKSAAELKTKELDELAGLLKIIASDTSEMKNA